MSDRAEEVTEPRATEDVIAETDELLSGEPSAEHGRDTAGDEATAERSDSARSSSSGRLGSYFSPKAFLGITLVLGLGFLLGNAVIPFASIGAIVGALAIAFTVGLATSKRRYLEVGLGGLTAGGLSALLQTDLTTALLVSFSMPILIGAGVGAVTAVAGYYFGRDLRDGLARDIE